MEGMNTIHNEIDVNGFYNDQPSNKCTVNPKSFGEFNPYTDNGGSCIALAGSDFAVIVSDTRLSQGYRIASRSVTRVFEITTKCVLSCSGMFADITALQKLIRARVKIYEFEHKKSPSIGAVAQLLSTVLYSKRFFPYYCYCAIAGLDEYGNGVAYGYDAVGSFQSGKYFTNGTGSHLISSILDNQISGNNQLYPKILTNKVDMIDLLKDAITSASERDVYTGDSAQVVVIDASGISKSSFPLRQD
ncbi:proteasome subunit beta type 1 [Cryptosporidium andersoni]|uniref:Proteasome subunit beta type 1 n=1 Tax=Cryptosporidium andersoni TaxID=117008 RepID=A0A1J4MAB6_9CRYT|nr:proteasome subunit beta type 1 [Cryptosporidium andersoni]